ncbi:Hpt domain-containing protein [Actibacterium sp. 188UL27-1]|uniref:Hpt domain-containing protein n=1 Tax=Actibacterium sp. 188UL27-1 TaxID=2786961 RepID=UPI00195AAA3F|nr:Hpt domain-containing protein [Actibacterium sp. 188UL27-1]MBM7067063.1 Hpt domain-containing protein [Actibacterium sp. 188UL27-1]
MIDWDRVNELRNEVGNDGFAEIVELFLDEADAAIRDLKNGVSENDLEQALHFLKGCALNLGFSELAKHCQIGEIRAMEQKFDQIDLPIVIKSYQLARAEFTASADIKIAS